MRVVRRVVLVIVIAAAAIVAGAYVDDVIFRYKICQTPFVECDAWFHVIGARSSQ